MRPLEDIQREFLSALQLPLRGTSRRSTSLPPCADGHTPEFLAAADRLLQPGENLSPAERLELYHRQYWFRLLDSLADDFPILRRMAGEETFWRLLEGYLQAFPSASFTLRHLGRSLALHLRESAGLADREALWFPAIAEMEYAAMETFEAAEREPLPPDRIATEVLELQPHVRLLSLPVPADLCHAWPHFTPTPPHPTKLAVWRGDAGAHLGRLEEAEFVLLERLRDGRTLDDLFSPPPDPPPTPDDVQRWFAAWQARGWITTPDSHLVELAIRPDEDWTGVDKMGSQARAMDENDP